MKLSLVVLLSAVLMVSSYADDAEKSKSAKPAGLKSESPKSESKQQWNATQKQVIAQLEALFEASKKVNDPKTKAASRAKIEKAIDWDTISRKCLGEENWKKNPKGRKSFAALLSDIVALSAYSRMEDFWKNASYKYTTVDVKGSDAHLTVEFVDQHEDEYELDYYMSKKGSQWHLTDLAYEDLKYSENINEQIVAFLKEKSFSSLLDRMTKRKQELIADEKAGKKAKAGSKAGL